MGYITGYSFRLGAPLKVCFFLAKLTGCLTQPRRNMTVETDGQTDQWGDSAHLYLHDSDNMVVLSLSLSLSPLFLLNGC